MNFVSLVLIGIAAMLCLTLGIILFVILYQRRMINHQTEIRALNAQKELELMQAAIESEEKERSRIASELHDDVGATLSSIRLFLHQAIRTSAGNDSLGQCKDLLDDSIRKIRDLSHQLQPGALHYLGLQKSLQSLAELISRSGAIQMTYSERHTWPETDAATSLAIYRIVQELVNNILKHAAAARISLSAGMHGTHYCISLAHDGNGLTEEAYRELLYKKGAIGLKNIEHRLKSANLSLTFPPQEGEWSAIHICLPATPSKAHKP